jgi:hypothetical protein
LARSEGTSARCPQEPPETLIFVSLGLMSATITGGCLCGTTRYKLTGSPKQTSICHCIDCRRSSAAPFVAWAGFQRENIALVSGELMQVRHAGRIRSFARCCGTPIFFLENEDSEWIDVTICSMDQPEMLAPDVAIWTEDRLPWIAPAGALPEFRRARETS